MRFKGPLSYFSMYVLILLQSNLYIEHLRDTSFVHYIEAEVFTIRGDQGFRGNSHRFPYGMGMTLRLWEFPHVAICGII